MNTEISPLTASKRGDREAFGEIIRKYQNTVCAVTYSITGNLQQSEDLAQETFVTAWLRLTELRDESKFPAWLCGIARNLAHNWVRKNARQKTPVSQTELVEQLAAMPENHADESPDEADREAKSAMVWEILRELPETYREPLVLFYQQSQSITDIAAALDLSEENVRQRLSRGRAKIRTEVAGRIEQALSALQPDKMFYLAVLAALPVACAVTTSAAVAGTTSVGSVLGKSGGGLACSSASLVVGWIWMLGSAVILPIVGIVFGCRSLLRQIRNAPSLRVRRMLLRNAMLMQESCVFVAGSIFAMTVLPFTLVFKLISVMILFDLFGVFWIYHVAFSNKLFRRFLEEEAAPDFTPAKPIEQTWLSRKTIHCTFVISLVLSCLGVSGIVYYTFAVSADVSMTFFRGYFPFLVLVFLLMIPIRLVVFYMRGLRFASDEGMRKYPSEIPDILDIVLGKAEMPEKYKTFRGRAGADMIAMGCLMFGTSSPFVLFGMAQPNPWWGYVLIGGVTLLFAIFVKFFAGRPKWRHLGWIVTSMAMCLLFMLTIWGVLHDPLMQVPELYIMGIVFYVVFGFMSFITLVGYCFLHENELNQLNEKHGIRIRFK